MNWKKKSSKFFMFSVSLSCKFYNKENYDILECKANRS